VRVELQSCYCCRRHRVRVLGSGDHVVVVAVENAQGWVSRLVRDESGRDTVVRAILVLDETKPQDWKTFHEQLWQLQLWPRL
jgi:hypothetical protein